MKNCPFCGSSHTSVEERSCAWNGKDRALHVICNDCAASAPVDAWMNRMTSLSSAAEPAANHVNQVKFGDVGNEA
jgi:transcription elongation factor Elf1